MFSQFRNAVESFAPQPRRSIDETHNSGEDRANSPGQLAEHAFTNLRKSFASQRPASPAPKSGGTRSQKSTLEERLRAVAFTIGDASNGTTPDPSARASPAPSRTEVKDHPLSPTSTPLPESRPTSPPADANAFNSPSIDSVAAVGEKEVSSAPEANSTTEAEQHSSKAAGTPAEEVHTPVLEPTDVPVDTTDAKPDVDPKSDTETKEASETEQPVAAEKSDIVKDAVTEDSNTTDLDPVVDTSEVTPPLTNEVVTEKSDTTLDTAVDILDSTNVPSGVSTPRVDSPTVEKLQERLQLVEKRFTDVSTSFKRLQAEKLAADAILRELTPVESTKDTDSLRDYLQNMKLKIEISQEEMNRLNNKLATQEDRIEELRDTHRLETRSQSDQIENLRKQLAETESLLQASQGSLTKGEDQAASQKAEIEQLRKEMEKAKEVSKEEEEKRVKAISLLKTVRQKLVKAEKDKEDAVKELSSVREQEAAAKSKEEAEKTKLRSEVESAMAEKEKSINAIKAQYEKELSLAKERHEREMSALRGQFELEAVTTKSSHGKELSQKDARISELESKMQSLGRDKSALFDQLQQRQAEIEGLQAEADSVKNENVELSHQVRESEDHIALLKEELAEARREQDRDSQEGMGNTEEAARVLSALEAKYEAKVASLERTIASLEKERTESESEWSRKVREKNKEVADLKSQIGSATRLKEKDDDVVDKLKAEVERLEQLVLSKESLKTQNSVLTERLAELENASKARLVEYDAKIKVLEEKIEEGKTRENQLRSSNKTLREELRKVQSSVALLDRQRNPGVGYWTSKDSTATDSRVSISSASSDGPGQDIRSPKTESNTPAKDDEEVNLEYLRNVILQFLEHKDMRPSLVKVLSVILHFTPQETRRLIAKV